MNRYKSLSVADKWYTTIATTMIVFGIALLAIFFQSWKFNALSHQIVDLNYGILIPELLGMLLITAGNYIWQLKLIKTNAVKIAFKKIFFISTIMTSALIPLLIAANKLLSGVWFNSPVIYFILTIYFLELFVVLNAIFLIVKKEDIAISTSFTNKRLFGALLRFLVIMAIGFALGLLIPDKEKSENDKKDETELNINQ